MSLIKLDIGCGRKAEEGWVGYDIVAFDNVKQYDMTKDKLPYANGTVDAIRCINTLEHIERKHYKFIFNHWHDILKIGGTLEIIVPNAAMSTEHMWGDITHVSPWVMATFKYLTGERPRYSSYGFKHWKIEKLENYKKEERDIYALLTPKIDKHGNKYE